MCFGTFAYNLRGWMDSLHLVCVPNVKHHGKQGQGGRTSQTALGLPSHTPLRFGVGSFLQPAGFWFDYESMAGVVNAYVTLWKAHFYSSFMLWLLLKKSFSPRALHFGMCHPHGLVGYLPSPHATYDEVHVIGAQQYCPTVQYVVPCGKPCCNGVCRR